MLKIPTNQLKNQPKTSGKWTAELVTAITLTATTSTISMPIGSRAIFTIS